MTTLPVKSVPVTSVGGGQPLQLPFDFWSEFRPQKLDVEFVLNVRDQSETKLYKVVVYRGSVTIEEPPQSLLDLQLLSVYAFLAALVGGILYMVYKNYFPTRKSSSRKPAPAPAPAPAHASKQEKNTGVTYDEQWIPQETLRTRKQRGRK